VIDNLHELSNTITAVANRILEIVTEHSTSSQRYVGYDDVSDLISEEDYLTYFDFISSELQGREEILDLDTADNEFDIVCGLRWCRNYEPLSEEEDILRYDLGSEKFLKAPSMSRMAEIGELAIKQMILNGNEKPLDFFELGVTGDEIAYMRTLTGHDHPKLKDLRSVLETASSPVTEKDYEDLVIQSVMRYESFVYSGLDPERVFAPGPDGTSLQKRPHPFYICILDDQQTNQKVLDQYPEARNAFRKIFSEAPQTEAMRAGAVIDGRPALIYSLKLNDIEDPVVRHAMAAMTAGQLDAAFSGSNIKITYGVGISDYGNGEILAILPADADMDLLRRFEQVFVQTLHDRPFTGDARWVESQYQAILNHTREQLPRMGPFFSPWAKALPEKAALLACHALGSYLGRNHMDWTHAQLTHDEQRLCRLQDKLTVIGNDEVLSAVTHEGMYAAEQSLSKSVTLYTNEKGTGTNSFSLPLGKLSLALQEKGYSKDQPVTDFLMNYHPEDAREIKAIIDHMPKRSLSQQVSSAEERRKSEDHGQNLQAKEKSVDRDF